MKIVKIRNNLIKHCSQIQKLLKLKTVKTHNAKTNIIRKTYQELPLLEVSLLIRSYNKNFVGQNKNKKLPSLGNSHIIMMCKVL